MTVFDPSRCLRIYLAGPDVFAPDQVNHGQSVKDTVRAFGYLPLYPLDNEIQSSDNLAKDIFEANRTCIQSCDLVLANLNPFRGSEPDSGTVWEIGYAYALGKPVIGYMNDFSPMTERIGGSVDLLYDHDGWHVENFGWPLNLMIMNACHTVVHGELEDALKFVQRNLFGSR